MKKKCIHVLTEKDLLSTVLQDFFLGHAKRELRPKEKEKKKKKHVVRLPCVNE